VTHERSECNIPQILPIRISDLKLKPEGTGHILLICVAGLAFIATSLSLGFFLFTMI
jgi:hypothetical protein